MELENQTTKQAYIQMLLEILRKKLAILNELMRLTLVQEELMKQEPFNEDEFLKTIDEKEKQLKALTELDTGFEHIYDRVREELTTQKANYYHEITLMQEYISSITDISVKLQATEKRNRSRLEQILLQKRKDIKQSRVNSQMVTKYYKSIANQNDAPSYFYDKKK